MMRNINLALITSLLPQKRRAEGAPAAAVDREVGRAGAQCSYTFFFPFFFHKMGALSSILKSKGQGRDDGAENDDDGPRHDDDDGSRNENENDGSRNDDLNAFKHLNNKNVNTNTNININRNDEAENDGSRNDEKDDDDDRSRIY